MAVEIDLSRTALIVVDMQNDFLHAEGWFARAGHDASAPVETIEALASACRESAVPVVWLNWGVRAGVENLPASTLYRGKRRLDAVGYGERAAGAAAGALERGSWGAGLVEGLTRHPQDIEVSKHRFSGFPDSELDSILRNLAVDTLLFAGINTDRCVFATLTDASARGYDCVLVRDACATLSPAAVEQSVIWLVDLLYGFSTDTTSLLPALAARPNLPEQGCIP